MNPILITIDVEECDIPLEYGIVIPLEEQLLTGQAKVGLLKRVKQIYGIFFWQIYRRD